MKTLNEEIGRIKDIMLINEIGGGSLEDFMDMGFKSDREDNPHMSKKYNPENEIEFPDSKVTDVVWRAGGLDEFHKGGGIWFGVNKSDVEKFDTGDEDTQVYSKQYVVFNPENIKPA